MPNVNVTSETLRSQLSELKQAAEQVATARQSIVQQYQQLSSGWNDSKNRELGVIVNETNAALRNIEKVFLQGQKSLLAIFSAVMEYESQNLNRSSGVSNEISFSEGIATDTVREGVPDNMQIACAAVSNGLVKYADFGGLDPLTAREIYLSIEETKEQFPELDLRFVGSAQSRNYRIAEQLKNMYLNVYRLHYPTAPDSDLMPMVIQLVDEDMRGFEMSDGTIAQSLFISEPSSYGEEIISEFNGITINESYGANYEHFTEVRRSDVLSRWKPEGCDTPRATVDHELGHQIARLTNAHNDDCIQELYANFLKLSEINRGIVLSGYAGESIHEFIAESWSEYRNNPNCRPLAMEVSNRMIDIYNSSTMQLVRRMRR